MSISADLFALSQDDTGRSRMHPIELGCAIAAAELVDLAMLGRIVINADAVIVRNTDPVEEPMLDARLAWINDQSRLGPTTVVGAVAFELIGAYDSAWDDPETTFADRTTERGGREAVLEEIVQAVSTESEALADEVLLAFTDIARLSDHLVGGLKHRRLRKQMQAWAAECRRRWTTSPASQAAAADEELNALRSSVRNAVTTAARCAADPGRFKGPSALGAAWSPDPRGGLPIGIKTFD